MARPTTPDPSIVQNASSPRKLFIVLKSQEQKQLTQFDAKDDYTDTIRTSLGTYASEVTNKNEFPLSSQNSIGSLTTATGAPAALTPDNANGQKSYLETFRSEGVDSVVQNFSSTNSVFGDKFRIRKGAEDSNLPTGATVYREVDLLKGNSRLAKAVDEVLEDNGKNAPTKPFVEGTNFDNDTVLGSINFRTIGSGTKHKFPTTVYPEAVDQISIKDMKKLGLLTMLQACGESFTPSLDNESVVTDFLATSVSPGLSRMGLKISTSRFSPANAIKGAKPGFVKSEHTNFLDPQANESYGNTNSYFVPFDSLLSSAPSILSATILMTTVGGLLRTLGLFNLIRQQDPPVAPYGNAANRQRWMGSFAGTAGQINNTLIFLAPTTHEFFDCLNRGLETFFGINITTPGAAFGTGAVSITKLHGYYNVILRSVTRSINELFDPKSSNTNGLPLAIDPRTNLKNFNDSAVMKFVNVLITIGDRVLTAEDQQAGLGLTDLTNSDVDSIAETITIALGAANSSITVLNPSVLQAKNRLNDGRLSMANTTLKSLLMLPQNVISAGNALTGDGAPNMSTFQAKLSEHNKVVSATDDLEPHQGRIKQQIVKQIEDYLERDYMPFYFHDIRTNEILSFHAFLENVADGLTADYTKTEAYGRIGGIQTYKNTEREISLSFTLLSTSEVDFDHMWYKLNRLAMMLYPQWTEGRKVSFGNNKFVQPFSQIPGASPMVRLRLGDLFKSNYSKFAAARLFGLGNGIGTGENNSFNLESFQRDASASQSQMQQSQQLVANAQTLFQDQQQGLYLANTPSTNRVRLKASTRGYPRVNPANPSIADRTGALRLSTDVLVKITAALSSESGRARYRVRVLNYTPPASSGNRPSNAANPTTNNEYIVTQDDLTPDMSLIQSELRGNSDGAGGAQSQSDVNSTTNNATQISDFFSGDNNPIIKAFESTKGRGLAGFIKSMRMNYESARWVTDKANGRAPMLVKVEMEFAPIYDINPGLDSNGFMTAPIWNVGNIVGSLHDASALQNSFELLQQSRSSLLPPRR